LIGWSVLSSGVYIEAGQSLGFFGGSEMCDILGGFPDV